MEHSTQGGPTGSLCLGIDRVWDFCLIPAGCAMAGPEPAAEAAEVETWEEEVKRRWTGRPEKPVLIPGPAGG
jgi:hypothetical protein